MILSPTSSKAGCGVVSVVFSVDEASSYFSVMTWFVFKPVIDCTFPSGQVTRRVSIDVAFPNQKLSKVLCCFGTRALYSSEEPSGYLSFLLQLRHLFQMDFYAIL